MPDIVNCIEDRGAIWLYHWMVYMVSGFRHLQPASDGHIYIYFEKSIDTLSYCLESLALLEDKYHLYKKEDILPETKVIKCFGEPLLTPNTGDDVNHDAYPFLRNLFLQRIEHLPKRIINPNGYYYITRRNASACPGNYGKRIRDVLNEEEFLPALESKGFVRIQFEELTFLEKIQLFQTAKVVISPNSASLTFSCFASKQTHIVEILPVGIQTHDHYKNMCETLEVPYYRFTDIHTEGESPGINKVWNIHVHVEPFLHFVDGLLQTSGNT